ncbi:MAG: hypothetical protein RML37_12020 [Chitinophagales bacterium]|nr:hypothetical protein [Chitinophagales bacterium]
MKKISFKLTCEQLRYLLHWIDQWLPKLPLLNRALLTELYMHQYPRTVITWQGQRKVTMSVAQALALRELIAQVNPGYIDPYVLALVTDIYSTIDQQLPV